MAAKEIIAACKMEGFILVPGLVARSIDGDTLCLCGVHSMFIVVESGSNFHRRLYNCASNKAFRGKVENRVSFYLG